MELPPILFLTVLSWFDISHIDPSATAAAELEAVYPGQSAVSTPRRASWRFMKSLRAQILEDLNSGDIILSY
jgi:hypothetical protein